MESGFRIALASMLLVAMSVAQDALTEMKPANTNGAASKPEASQGCPSPKAGAAPDAAAAKAKSKANTPALSEQDKRG